MKGPTLKWGLMKLDKTIFFFISARLKRASLRGVIVNASEIGIHLSIPEPSKANDLIELAKGIDSLGFDCIYFADQIANFMDPLHLLTFIAAITKEVRQGTCVYLLPLRNPFFVAKYISTIQRLSGRRFSFGVGVGWRKGEFDVLNVPWNKRGRIADEALRLLKTAWSSNTFSFRGEFFSAENLDLNCSLEQQPEIMIGGNSDSAIRRAVKYGDGWIPTDLTVEEYEKTLPIIKRMLEDVGREYERFKISSHLILSLGKEAEEGKRLAQEGAKRFGIDEIEYRRWTLSGSPAEVSERLASYKKVGVSYHVLALYQHSSSDDIFTRLKILVKEVLPSV